MNDTNVQTQLKVFEHKLFGKVRTITLDGEPWMVGNDIAVALGYSNPRDALVKHVDNEDKGVAKCDTLGGRQNLTIINESGLYALVLSSKLPDARKFRRWITSEVLPSIRKHGAYMTPETLEAAILNPDIMIQLCQELKKEQEKRRALEAANAKLTNENQVMLPKAQFYDDLVERNHLTNFRETAKELQVSERKFIKFLLAKKLSLIHISEPTRL